MLGYRMSGGICFSSEKAGGASLAENGIGEVELLVGRASLDMYSPDRLRNFDIFDFALNGLG
jgi:phosphonoacetate hydrolase